MTCQEFQRVLPELEGSGSFEADEHLRVCSHCWDMVSDLDAISMQAHDLQAGDEPSPRVWNSIEIVLRQEGVIHPPELQRRARQLLGWRSSWLATAAAALLLVFGFALRQHQNGPVQLASRGVTPPVKVAVARGSVGDDDQVLSMVAMSAPGLRAGYATDLRAVDAYIRDAESSAQENPNDEIAQQYLTNAYEQRAMVYEMAMARSLP